VGIQSLRILLDTNALIWACTNSSRLGRSARAAIVDPVNEVWVSAVTAFELALKNAAGRLRLRRLADHWLREEMAANDFYSLALTIDHSLAAGFLPRHHFDPFDHLLIAQAQIEDLRLLTADSQFEKYDVRLIDATE
jgi:PIN domain nuclease of toxin-antitoxin system